MYIYFWGDPDNYVLGLGNKGTIMHGKFTPPQPPHSFDLLTDEYLRGDICVVSAVQPPTTRFLPTKVKREQMTKVRETRDNRAELVLLILSRLTLVSDPIFTKFQQTINLKIILLYP